MLRRQLLLPLLGLVARCVAHDLKDLGLIPDFSHKGKRLAARPRVILFLHVPKCGGTTVGGMFAMHNWTRTLWSVSQRFTGWKANRLLHAIRSQLALNKTRIFAEWHLDYNFSMVPAIAGYVRQMRPDVDFRAFTVLRTPLELVGSNGAWWSPITPATHFIRAHPEMLLFGSLRLPVPQLNGTVVCSRKEEREFCEEAALQNARARASNVAKNGFYVPPPRVPIERADVEMAEDYAARRAARLQRVSEAGSCTPLVEEALEMLAPLDSVLLLEDKLALPTLQAVALGDLSFRPPRENVSVELPRALMSRTATITSRREPYRRPEAVEAARAENLCSAMLYERLWAQRSQLREQG